MLSGVRASVPRSSLGCMQGWGGLQLSQNNNNTCSDTATLSQSNRTSKQENMKPVNYLTMIKEEQGIQVLQIQGRHTWMASLLLPGVADRPRTRNLHFSSRSFFTASTTSLFPFALWHSSTTRHTTFLWGQMPIGTHTHTAEAAGSTAVLQAAIRVMGMLKVTSFCSRQHLWKHCSTAGCNQGNEDAEGDKFLQQALPQCGICKSGKKTLHSMFLSLCKHEFAQQQLSAAGNMLWFASATAAPDMPVTKSALLDWVLS